MLKSPEVLKKYWGYDSFRPLQSEIIDSVLAGNDTLALLPTGGGKSVCFQVPALLNEGLCLVVTPLIALMKDQVSNLKQKGIPALSIYSGMKFIEVKKTLENAAYGNFKFLYVSPERLETDLFLEYLPIINVNLVAVDEAHCISQWGYDFRPPYLRIAALREYFKNVPFLALTASATSEVQKDICSKLEFGKSQKIFQQSFERPNLSYSAFQLFSKENKLLTILKKVAGSGIVYCKTRRRTKEVSELLNLNGIVADFYHAGLSGEDRSRKQEEWIHGKTRIIACTNAFGMGIDKPDVRVVVHYEVPDALENYYQEAGRAGRDGNKAYAVLLYSEAELESLKKQIDIRFPPNEIIKKIYGDLCSFLQIPANSGEGFYYDFDLNTFAKNFKLNAFTVNSVLKILEQEEMITYSEQFFMPSTVEFAVDKKGLDDFEISHPNYAEVVKGLLRSYDGIFDFPAFVNETDLSKVLGIKREALLKILQELNAIGIINYVPQKENPQIYFLKNRVRTQELFINQKNILKRKEAYKERLNAIIRFCISKIECRSSQIGFYFNGKYLPRCGVCDNCLRDKKEIISSEEFNFISSEIKNIMNTEAATAQIIINHLHGIKENKIWKVLRFLEEEEMITVNKEGILKVVKTTSKKRGPR
ncbi:MAG: ATP-dependent DNA helicase RecQ [Ginsengibacter sp.]